MKKRVVLLVAVDQTEASVAAIDTASALARTIPGCEIHLVHVIPLSIVPALDGIVVPSLSGLFEEGRMFIDRIAARIDGSFEGRVSTHLSVGMAATHILQLASNLQADFVVVGSNGKNAVERVIVGSVSASVAQKAQCTVIVARPKAYIADPSVPEIEPACAACLEIQQSSQGERLWCTRHSTHHAQGHVYFETPEPFGVGSTFIRPELS